MKNDDEAVCVACGKKAGELEEYDADNLVQDDGTYKDHKFVCTSCYCELIPMGLDVGSPDQVQANAIKYIRKSNDLRIFETDILEDGDRG